ncbi:hypothetical protein M5K25_023389 [Dendrobium thyrsiflorum]|uniref:Uncharacterized protein n=1 Tax=Dendrobium thyrsiflorum TaxID=117978 RepID=A0ABD0UEY9_DENTH
MLCDPGTTSGYSLIALLTEDTYQRGGWSSAEEGGRTSVLAVEPAGVDVAVDDGPKSAGGGGRLVRLRRAKLAGDGSPAARVSAGSFGTYWSWRTGDERESSAEEGGRICELETREPEGFGEVPASCDEMRRRRRGSRVGFGSWSFLRAKRGRRGRRDLRLLCAGGVRMPERWRREEGISF